MTGVWTYPWCFPDDELDSAFESLADSGIDRLKVAAHYHSVRTFDPKAADLGFDVFPGGCLFTPDETHFRHTPIEPPRNESNGHSDSFNEIVSAATDRGFDVDAWAVCLHGTRLASQWSEYQIEDAFGDSHTHSLCPSYPEVREYFAGVIANIARYEIDQIDLESIGFPSVCHGHGASFGHHKDHVITTRTEEFLVSQCFCDGCRRAAEGRIDLAAAQEVVLGLCRQFLTRPNEEIPSLSELVEEYPILDDLFTFRESVVESLLSRLESASGDAKLAYYLADGGGYTPAELWPSGVTPTLLSTYLDTVTVLCYTGDLETIDRRITACRESLPHEFDAGVTLDPAVVEDRDHWNRLSTRVTEAINGELFVYNHGLMTDTHLEWVATHGARQLN